MGIFTEGRDDWLPEHGYQPKSTGGEGSPPLPGPKTPSSHALRGLHARTGTWVTLARFDDAEDAQKALRACAGKTQPDVRKVVIGWEHFAAYNIEPLFEVRYRAVGGVN